MRFNDEYRKEMNSKTLSEDFIKNLASRMAEEAAESRNTENNTDKENRAVETIETKAVEYRENKTMTGIKITAVIAAAAAVVIVFGSVLNRTPQESENITIAPSLTQITELSETAPATEESLVSESSEDLTTSESSPSVTEIVTVTEPAGTVISEVPASEPEKEAENTTVNAEVSEHDDSYYTENISEILEAHKVISSFSSGGAAIERDENDFIIMNDDKYYRITDSRFQSVEDLKAYINTYLAEDTYNENLDNYFMDIDSGLYVKEFGRGYKYAWDTSYAPEIVEKSDNSFTFIQAYLVPGINPEYARVTMVKSDTYPGWKIASIEDISR